jgi:hypothetical protein
MSNITNIFSSCGHLLAEATPIELNTFHGIPLGDNRKLYGLTKLLIDGNTSNSIDILPISDPIEGWKYLHEVDVGAFFVWNIQSEIIENIPQTVQQSTIGSKNPFSNESINALNEWIKNNPSKMIFTEEKYQKIIHHLLNPDEPIKDSKEKSFKHRALKNYTLNNNILYYNSLDNIKLKVVKEDEVFNIIQMVHCNLGHIGITKTFNSLQNDYHGITKIHVTEILKECSVCVALAISKSVPPLKPIISS